MSPRHASGGAKVQVSLTFSLSDLIKLQRKVEVDGSTMSQVIQQVVSTALAKESE